MGFASIPFWKTNKPCASSSPECTSVVASRWTSSEHGRHHFSTLAQFLDAGRGGLLKQDHLAEQFKSGGVVSGTFGAWAVSSLANGSIKQYEFVLP
ncbi:hypothetical protein ACFVFH_34615 [Streptomyces sp. NPDC057697]|uniref:hypothetical protein n=1 Tax=Streptomyces sp. NPDC057697 TaxID=3346219 RepID=UPI0036B22426